jgi:nucleobase:cation symporter-1, NCS1 family
MAVSDTARLGAIKAQVSASPLYNEDLAPTEPEERTWTTYNIAALWIGMAIVITTYTLASGLMAAGMTWWQALLTISLGNVIVLVPMLLNAHAGTKYGVPFPVFVRASFGVRGANFAAIARALVACGWFGIQTWIGGLALDALLTVAWGGWASVPEHAFITFFIFWAVQVVIILTGIEGVRIFESYSAPLLIAGGVALLIWGFVAGGGVGNVFSTSAELQQGQASFWAIFPSALAANVGYWITLSLNIPDFTRYAKSQQSQIVGQVVGLPLTMTAFSFIGIAVTAATVVVFGEAIWDPVQVVTQVASDLPTALVLAMVIIVIAQISTNMAANFSPPRSTSPTWRQSTSRSAPAVSSPLYWASSRSPGCSSKTSAPTSSPGSSVTGACLARSGRS